MNGILKIQDVIGMYVNQLEQQVAQLQQENAALKEQIRKMEPEAKA